MDEPMEWNLLEVIRFKFGIPEADADLFQGLLLLGAHLQ